MKFFLLALAAAAGASFLAPEPALQSSETDMAAITFSFAEAPNLGVYVCHHVSKEGQPILHVVHDADGDWQFLCGGDHSASARADLRCLEHVVADDPSLNELASLGCNYSASRDSADAPWVITDESEQVIRDNIAEHGWHIVVIPDDDEGPGFAYSIGMEKTLGHPEIVMFGLPGKLMGRVINEIGARVRNGEELFPDQPIDDLLEGTPCILRPVGAQHYREYFGYARWYYSGNGFRVWQCFWPGKQDRLFPWEEGSAQVVRDRQPDLTRPTSGEMEKAAKYTQPGPEHELLKRFLGDWDVTAQITMAGMATPPTKGEARTRWKVEGRWLESEWEGSLMGLSGRAFHIMGYDRVKMSYVWTGFTTFDTAMNHAEGDAMRDGKTLILYGTLDEYFTGEHDKMVKYVYRFQSDDKIVLEVHDLPIGEKNTKVMEFVYTRKKSE